MHAEHWALSVRNTEHQATHCPSISNSWQIQKLFPHVYELDKCDRKEKKKTKKKKKREKKNWTKYEWWDAGEHSIDFAALNNPRAGSVCVRAGAFFTLSQSKIVYRLWCCGFIDWQIEVEHWKMHCSAQQIFGYLSSRNRQLSFQIKILTDKIFAAGYFFLSLRSGAVVLLFLDASSESSLRCTGGSASASGCYCYWYWYCCFSPSTHIRVAIHIWSVNFRWKLNLSASCAHCAFDAFANIYIIIFNWMQPLCCCDGTL